MYKVIWDAETNGVLLKDNVDGSDNILLPRPVFFEELDLLGFNNHWQYPKTELPLLWANGRSYYYKGEKVAEAKKGNIFEPPEITIKNEARRLILEPVNVKLMLDKNSEALRVLENEAMDFVEHTYKSYRNKVDCFTVSFSGGKDSQVVLDIVSRVIPPDEYIVVFTDTDMELPLTYEIIKETEAYYKKLYPDLKFYTAKGRLSSEESWKKFGPPSQILRWCCTVHKTAPYMTQIKSLLNIAELSKNNNVFLYVITHKTPEQAGLKDEEIKKVFDRFYFKDYSMEPVTTYHIISAAIQKKDKTKWSELRDRFLSSNPQLNSLIDRISDNQNSDAKNRLKDLFPLHPYTAYLATFIARNIGSTERSIFTFLNDEERGFKKFLNNEVNDSSSVITADYLWDYFIEEFEKDNSNKFAPVLEKFRLHTKDVESAGAKYSPIFKGLLLLNALHRMVSTSEATQGLTLPSESNIASLFYGTTLQQHITEALQFIDKKEIVRKTPDSLYLVAFSTLPVIEIEKEKQKLISEYEDITKTLEMDGNLRKSLEDLVTNGVLRISELIFCWAGEKEHILKSKLLRAFKKGYSLHLAICLQKDNTEGSVVKNVLRALSREDDFKNIIFILPDKSFGKDRFEKFIAFYAESCVARNHNLSDDSITNVNYAKRIVQDWINNIKQGYVTVIYDGQERFELMSRIGTLINKQISPYIFKYSLENLQEARKNQNIWSPKMARNSAEIFLTSNSKDTIVARTNRAPELYLRSILKDDRGYYVVEENLEFKENADREHPLVKISKEIEQKINDFQNHPNFNLGERLQFLTQPPYGLYPNMINMALIGFALRKYIGKLYEANTGRVITETIMRDKTCDLFRFFQDGSKSYNLEVRLGTPEEKELTEKLKDIFGFSEVNGLNNVRWKIREFIKKTHFPIWSIKYLDIKDGVKIAAEEIFILTKNTDQEIGSDDIRRALEVIKNNKLDLELKCKPEKIQQGFISFLKQIESASITEEESWEVIDYLNKNMQEEIAQWEEEKVASKVKDWRLSKSQTLPPDVPTPPAEPPVLPPIPKPEADIIIKRVSSKIQEFDDKELKVFLLKILKHDTELAQRLNKYL